MSAALYYKQEGRREGKQEGKQEGLFFTAKNMLQRNTDIDFIREVYTSDYEMRKIKLR